ncbi:MAG: ABC transporter ATP-binding protein [Actinomycetaceae bacterium]|nr:ABC transporter ATP-binding protein [Actinomycetaceae bacterium]
MNNLQVENLNVHYGTFHAVKNVDLEIPEGQIVALLGGSGSGKSSLLRAIAGLEHSTGKLHFAGEDLRPIPVHRRHFGLMFQDGQLFGHRSVAGNIEFGLQGMSKALKVARTAELLELVGLAGYEARRISTLSGGQQQRVALARALAPRPRLLLLDEPLSALDRSLREQLALEIRRVVKEQGLTAIYVTHDQQEALAVADRVLVMQDGCILRDATPTEIWRDPQFLEVAKFLGFQPILPLALAGELGILPISEGGAPNLIADSSHAGAEVFLACAPGAFTYAERNTPNLCGQESERNTPKSVAPSIPVAERNTPNLRVTARVLSARVGRAVAELEVQLRAQSEPFTVVAPLAVLGQVPVEVELEIKAESVCLVTTLGFH